MAEKKPSAEIRLGVVFYGGVSLAVYMYGVTRELYELIVASAQQDVSDENGDEKGTRVSYAEALDRRYSSTGVRTDVVIDTITGTSAGGINGVYLAKAIAGNSSLGPLKDLWFEEADIKKLVRGIGPTWFRVLVFVIRMLLPGMSKLAPLRGDRITRMLYNGLEKMDASTSCLSESVTLIPKDQSLDLVVTLTDGQGLDREVSATSDGVKLSDRMHRHTMHFKSSPLIKVSGFSPSNNAALTFAARTTSSFPAAFPVVTINDFKRSLGIKGRNFDLDVFVESFFRSHLLAGLDPRNTWFIDGGVLDNKPIGHALSIIGKKPASSEVERHLLLVDPSPAVLPEAIGAGSNVGAPLRNGRPRRPRWFETAIAGLSTLPSYEPIGDEILYVRSRNSVIHRLNILADEQFRYIRDDVISCSRWSECFDSYEAVEESVEEVRSIAYIRIGASISSYRRLRLDSMHEYLAGVLAQFLRYPPESVNAMFVREALSHWVALRFPDVNEFAGEVDGFLRRFDVPFRERNLRFVIQGLNALYGDGISADLRLALDDSKRILYGYLRELWGVPQYVEQVLCESLDQTFAATSIGAVFGGNAADYAFDNFDDISGLLDMIGIAYDRLHNEMGLNSWSDFSAAILASPDDAKVDLLVRFIGFPLWDVSSFPLSFTSSVDHMTPMEVRRVSPIDATALKWTSGKLHSTGLGNFRGFFQRSYRENDYLWGRLDTLEILLKLICPDLSSSELSRAFMRVLEEERDLSILKETKTSSLLGRLRTRIDDLAKSQRIERGLP